jgi:hypothetical protein
VFKEFFSLLLGARHRLAVGTALARAGARATFASGAVGTTGAIAVARSMEEIHG